MAENDLQRQIPSVESAESVQTSKVAELFQQLWISADTDILGHIEKGIRNNPALLGSMEADAWAAQKTPSEKSRFELLYLKGYWQVVTLKDGRQMSFAEIVKLKGAEKDAVIDGMSDAEYTKYEKFLDESKQAASQRIDWKRGALDQTTGKRKEVGQALDQENKGLEQDQKALDQQTERLNILSTKAKSLMDTEGIQFLSNELQKIQSSPDSSPIVRALIKQWAKMEDVQSGKYNGAIESYIIVANETRLTPKDPEKAKEFMQVVEQMRGDVGVPPSRENIDRFLGSKVLGENREAIGTAMHELGRTGNYDRMMWDEDTRAVIFQGKNGEQVRIDTVSIPPRLTRSQDPLSISHDAEVLSQEERKQREKRENAEKLGEKWSSSYNEGISAYVQGRTNEYRLPVETREIFSRENGELQRDYERMERVLMTEQDSAKRMEQIREMFRINESMKQENLENMLETSERERHIEIDKMLEWRKENLRKIEQASTLIQEANASLAKLSGTMNENRYEKFYRVSDFNFSTMKDIDLHKMWPRAQEIIDRIIAEINRTRDSQNQIKLDEKILNESDRAILKKSLEKLGGTKGVLTSEKIWTFQKHLNTMLVKAPGAPGSIEDILKESASS